MTAHSLKMTLTAFGAALCAAFCTAFCNSMSAQMRVLFVGDSVTDGGWGKSCGEAVPTAQRNHWDQNHLYGQSFMMLCAAHYMANYPEGGFAFLNRGISGNAIGDLEERWQADVVSEKPDVLSILVGTNDVHYFLDDSTADVFNVADWEARYRALVSRLMARNPECRLVLCTPFTAPVGWAGEAANFNLRRKTIDELCQAVARIAADNNAVLVRFDQMFADLEQNGVLKGDIYYKVPMKHWIWDGIHPTVAGHRRMADLWIAKVREADILP